MPRTETEYKRSRAADGVRPVPAPLDGAAEFRGLGPPVGPEAAGIRTDSYLATHFPFNSRSAWSAICWRGELHVNGRAVRPAHHLRNGDVLAVYHPIGDEPDVDTGIELLAESAGVIAIYKPGNLPMHEQGYFRRRTVNALLAEKFGSEWFPVHRLDRETSGVLVCAATPELRHELSIAFEMHQVAKHYQAIVRGVCDWESVLVDQPIAEQFGTRKPRFGVDPTGAPATTLFSVADRAPNACFVDARPRTGKTNQIRVHAAWLAHALVGDKVYHDDPQVFAAYESFGDTDAVRALAGHSRHALHAHSVRLTHPATQREFSAISPLPADLVQLWQSLNQV